MNLANMFFHFYSVRDSIWINDHIFQTYALAQYCPLWFSDSVHFQFVESVLFAQYMWHHSHNFALLQNLLAFVWNCSWLSMSLSLFLFFQKSLIFIFSLLLQSIFSKAFLEIPSATLFLLSVLGADYEKFSKERGLKLNIAVTRAVSVDDKDTKIW